MGKTNETSKLDQLEGEDKDEEDVEHDTIIWNSTETVKS